MEKAYDACNGDVAALIAQPYDHGNFFDNRVASKEYWQGVREFCDKHHMLLIIDDVRAGFRLDLAGSDHYYGFKADLICFCKALANGYNMSAVCGREEFKATAASLSFTGSYWMSAEPFAACIACLDKMKRLDTPALFRRLGTKLTDGFKEAAKAHGFDLVVSGEPALFYLRIANELYLKRLIVGGFNGVYEFAKDFRNEGMDRTHNPEFTVMEIYVTYKDYLWMMDFTEEMVEQVALAVNGTTELEIWGQQVSFRRPFRRITMTDAIREKTGFDITGKSEEELREACRRLHVETDETMGKGKLIDALFGEYCERDLIQPTFVMDYPIEMSPLVKRHRNNPDLTERFELFVAGKELCNAYSELNDPIDQLGRFQEQLRLSEKGDDEAMFIDMDFVRALEYGMPPTSGMGMGIDRLTMFMTNQPSIQDVLLFPQMKPEKGVVRDNPEKYAEKGIPEEWVPVLHKMGFLTVDSLKKLSAGKLFNDLCGFNKKNKLGLKTPTAEEVKGWVE